MNPTVVVTHHSHFLILSTKRQLSRIHSISLKSTPDLRKFISANSLRKAVQGSWKIAMNVGRM